MIDQEQTIQLAIKAGVIDASDLTMDAIHISQDYIDDLVHFADLAQQMERAEIIKILELFFANLVEAGNQHGPYVIKLAIKMLEDLE